MGMAEITPTQRKVLDFVRESLRARGYPPTLREIGARLDITAPSSAAYHLKVLAAKGYLKRAAAVSRGLAPLEQPGRLPILGRVGAGGGMIAQEDVEGYLSLDEDAARQANYLLRVRGESMRDAGILEGDLVLVRRQDWADDGRLVVALVGEEGVVKRLRRRRAQWFLESAHPAYPPIVEEFRVLGAVVGLTRRY